MEPTIFGALVAGVAPLLVLFGPIESLLLFVLAMSLMGGASAVTLTALGGSSIMPANLAVCFLILRYLLPGRQQFAYLGQALKANAVLAVFVVYGVIGAYVLPRIFANAMYVTPLHPHPTRDPFAAEPLQFTTQNITISVYFLQTLLAAVGAHVVARRCLLTGEGRAAAGLGRLAAWAAGVGLVHAFLGFLSVVAKERLHSFFDFFRNGSYAQLNQQMGEVSRMNGIFPEPSNYAAYGFAWMVFLAELWLRDVRPRWTGPAAGALAAALLVSTSSTAYVGLLAYGLVLGPRLLMGAGQMPARKVLLLLGAGLGAVAAVLAVAVALPAVGAKLGLMLSGATLQKAQSASALQRGFWARQGLEAFVVSKGLGIGCGSFRSSSLITAILGCMGVVGIGCFGVFLAQVFMPLRRSTWTMAQEPVLAMGAAASWAAVLMLAPLMLTAPSPDPGIVWGIFCGLALALRGGGPQNAHVPAGLHHSETPVAHLAPGIRTEQGRGAL